MKDLTSTKREFTALGRRLYRRKPLSANRAFRRVIGRGFGIWIRDHWGLSNPGWIRPVDREFQTQKKPFAFWPPPKRTGEASYTFAPTIHLSCFPQQINNSLFEVDAAGTFQTLTLKQPAGAREEFVRNVLVEGNDRRTREYRLLDRIFHIFNRESNTHRENTKLKAFLCSLFSTLSRTEVRRLAGATSFNKDFARVRSSSATTEVCNHFISLPPLILAGNAPGEMADGKTITTGPRTNLSTSNHWRRTLDLHPRLDHEFLITRALSGKDAPAEDKSHFGTSVFTTLALNFAAPKVSEMELVAQRISQFVSSPELTHIKRQQAVSEEMISALRGLRTPYVEPKPAPAPVMPTIEQLTHQVRDQLERELRIERERRGL